MTTLAQGTAIACRIDVPAWLNTPALIALRAALAPAPLYAVGGCVRNHLWGMAVADIDLATPCAPDVVCEALDAYGIKYAPTGLAHGTVTAICDNRGYEITSFRHDRLPDGRHALVDFVPDMAIDAARRDFTVNALYMDATGGVYDPNGSGLDDIENKRMRFIGDPCARIMEDHLRLLRYFRFFSHYGYGEMDSDALEACSRLKDNLKNVSRERITQEFEKLLKGVHASFVLSVMHSHNILPDLLVENFNPKLYAHLYRLWQKRPDLVPDMALFAFSVWRNDVKLIIKNISQYIVLSGKYKKYIESLYKCLLQPTDKTMKNLYIYGQEITRTAIVFDIIINSINMHDDVIFGKLMNLKSQPIPVFPCSSTRLMEISGLGSGPAFGIFRARVENFWLETNCIADLSECELYAKSIL